MSRTEKVKRLRFVTTVPPKSEVRLVREDTEVSFVPMEAIGEEGQMQTDRTKRIEEVMNGYTYFGEGDVVMAKITPCFENGKGAIASGLVNGIGFGTTELHVLRANKDLDSRFLFYVTRSHDFRKLGEAEMYGAGGQKRVPESFVRDFRAYVPSLEEQRAIADFLDRETAKVDDLITRKQQLLTLLRSRQEAVVRQIVVGQDLDVPKRGSGYYWLGDTPSHWKVLALKRIAKRVVVGIAEASTHAYADSGIPLVRTTNVKANKIDTADLLYINKEFADKNRSKYMRAGDIVTARTGNPGISGVIPTELDGSQCFTMLITTLREDHVPEFFCYYINSEPARTYFALEGWGSAQINISVPILQMLPVPCPPEKEQRQIAQRIRRSMDAFERQVNLINEAIERLREYRSSLISTAMTGQIDVRNYRTQEAAALCQ